jgi:hypothetical protein
MVKIKKIFFRFYYIIMCCDFVLRCTWVLSISSEITIYFSRGYSDFFATAISCLELCRRCLWNFMKIEYEHIKNEIKLKACDDLNVPDEIVFNEDADDTLLSNNN